MAAGGPRGLFDHIYPLVHSDRTIEIGRSATYLALRERFLALNSPSQLEINGKASLTTNEDPRVLSGIGRPTLLAAGESDLLASPASIDATARLLPRGRGFRGSRTRDGFPTQWPGRGQLVAQSRRACRGHRRCRPGRH